MESEAKSRLGWQTACFPSPPPNMGRETCLFTAHPTGQNCLKTRNIVYFWEDPVLLINQRVNTCVAIRRTASSTRANLERWESSPHADFWPVKLPGGGGLRPAVLTPARASSKPRSPSMAGTGPRSPRRPWSIVSLTDIKA